MQSVSSWSWCLGPYDRTDEGDQLVTNQIPYKLRMSLRQINARNTFVKMSTLPGRSKRRAAVNAQFDMQGRLLFSEKSIHASRTLFHKTLRHLKPSRF